MRIDIITLFPELLKSPFEVSIVKRAIEEKKQASTFMIYAIIALINTVK